MGQASQRRAQSEAGRAHAVPLRETLLWMGAAALLLTLAAFRYQGGWLRNDSYHYLSAARNLAAGRGLSTSIVHYDTERASGVIPAPLTTFAPGYPLVVAGINLLGLGPEAAGVTASAIAFIALVPLVCWGAALFGLPRSWTRLVLVLLLGNATAVWFALAVASDSLFTVLATAAILLFVKWGQVGDRRPEAAWLLLGGAVVVGLGYWVRYAGLLLFLSLLAFSIMRLVTARDWRPLAASGLTGLMLGAVMLRNAVLAGTWKGGNEKVVERALLPVLRVFLTRVRDLVLGSPDGLESRLYLLDATFAVAATLIVILGLVEHRRHRRSPSGLCKPLFFPLLLATIYSAGLLYLCLTSYVSPEPRYFYPLLPIGLLCAAAFAARVEPLPDAGPAGHPLFGVAVVLLTASYLLVNGRSIVTGPRPAPHALVESDLAPALSSGQSARAWLEQAVPREATIAASDGQATGYALDRPTLSLIESEYSDLVWDEANLLGEMRRLGAQLLILYPGADPQRVPVQVESVILRHLLDGEPSPCWGLAAENERVRMVRPLC